MLSNSSPREKSSEYLFTALSEAPHTEACSSALIAERESLNAFTALIISATFYFKHLFSTEKPSISKWKSESSKVLILWFPSITHKIRSEAFKQAKELKSKSSIDQLHFPINILRSLYRVDRTNGNFHPYACEMTKQSKLMTDQHLPLIIPWRIALPFRTSLFFRIFPLQITVFPIKRHSRLYPGVLHH